MIVNLGYLYIVGWLHSSLLKTNNEWSFLQQASSQVHSCKSQTVQGQKGQHPLLCDVHWESWEVVDTPGGNLYTHTLEEKWCHRMTHPSQWRFWHRTFIQLNDTLSVVTSHHKLSTHSLKQVWCNIHFIHHIAHYLPLSVILYDFVKILIYKKIVHFHKYSHPTL